MIVLFLIACEDTKDPHGYHLKKGMLDEVRITRVVQNLSNRLSQVNVFELTKGSRPESEVSGSSLRST